MKKFFISSVLIICIIFLCSCSSEKTTSANSINNEIVSLICSETDYLNLSDETIKSLSVIYRTNLKYSNIEKLYNDEYFDERVFNLVNETENETLDNLDIKLDETINIYNNDDDTWKISISKSKLLEFCANKNISLTNISKIEPQYNDDKSLKSIKIAEKEFSFDEIKENFKIPSNLNLSIKPNVSSLEISGTYDKKNSFNIKKCEELAEKNYNYKTILKNNFE